MSFVEPLNLMLLKDFLPNTKLIYLKFPAVF